MGLVDAGTRKGGTGRVAPDPGYIGNGLYLDLADGRKPPIFRRMSALCNEAITYQRTTKRSSSYTQLVHSHPEGLRPAIAS